MKTTSSKIEHGGQPVSWIQKTVVSTHTHIVKFCTTMHSAKVQNLPLWLFPKLNLEASTKIRGKLDVGKKKILGKNLPVYIQV